ncbi:nucleotidyltransferase family protein [Sporosarcina sp. A2]|uniref:nucleotidyltransferase family protein n=1 Tax=Sporosarcina sp. A2 TaxID=3393449 RepID=UPI003D7B8D34
MVNYESQLVQIIEDDDYIMSVLKAVEKLQLNDTWISAGLIRNRVWDHLHNENTPINDIDVIYFDSIDTSLKIEKVLERKLESLMPEQPWSVKNQARMHVKNVFDCFNSSYEGVAHFPETPTAIAVRIYKYDIEIIAPYGLEDLFRKIVNPTPYFRNNTKLHSVYSECMKEKNWNEIWGGLSIKS